MDRGAGQEYRLCIFALFYREKNTFLLGVEALVQVIKSSGSISGS